MKVWRPYSHLLVWRWEATFRHPGHERVTLRGSALTKRLAERAARRALQELSR